MKTTSIFPKKNYEEGGNREEKIRMRRMGKRRNKAKNKIKQSK